MMINTKLAGTFFAGALMLSAGQHAGARQNPVVENLKKELGQSAKGPDAPENAIKVAPNHVAQSNQGAKAALEKVFDNADKPTQFSREIYLAFSPLRTQENFGRGNPASALNSPQSRPKPENWMGQIRQDGWDVGKIAIPAAGTIGGYAAGDWIANSAGLTGIAGMLVKGISSLLGRRIANSAVQGNLSNRFKGLYLNKRNLAIGSIAGFLSVLLGLAFKLNFSPLTMIGMIALGGLKNSLARNPSAQKPSESIKEDLLVV